MSALNSVGPRPRKPLRMWPGVVIVTIVLFLQYVLPLFVSGSGAVGALGALVGGLAIVLWWLFASRAPWPERLAAVATMALGLILTQQLLHPSMAEAGMGFLFFIYALPALSLALVLWAFLTRKVTGSTRVISLVVTLALACGVWTLLRLDGISGASADFRWRWTKTAEERLLAEEGTAPGVRPAIAAELMDTEPEWPGFRGPGRDGDVEGVRIATDWTATPPVELWRKAIGPGWSSFAVHGDLVYTQEQRGDVEVVSCYDARSGDLVWRHEDPVRFWEANAGAGPRGTPTLAGGRVYAFGATGILNVLEAADGTAVWSRDVASDTEEEVPIWGFSSSPLVIDDVVIVAASGQLAAYDLETGESRWLGADGGTGYSSPHRLTVGGVEQVVFQNGEGVSGLRAEDGAVLWSHEWSGYPIVQPALTANGDLLISVNQSSGTRRLSVRNGADGWTVDERWTTRGLKPYFSDFVVHRGHAYGFDGPILAAIGLEDGARAWKGGRFGEGQMVLLPEQDVLLVISEKGELALVSATPDQFTELARHPALEGKTWNHPVVVGDLLLVRNDREMVAFRLPAADA